MIWEHQYVRLCSRKVDIRLTDRAYEWYDSSANLEQNKEVCTKNTTFGCWVLVLCFG